jgi:hypothetical protein
LTFYHPDEVLWPTLEAIDKAYPIGLPIDDSSKLEELSKEFLSTLEEIRMAA